MAAGTDHALERLVFFSDAIFAIAITLLVIEIHPPHFPYGSPDGEHLWALLELTPEIAGFVLSFFVIGLFWLGHHRAFSLAAHYTPKVAGANLLLLGVIAFMPFVSAYASANPGQRVPTVFYCVIQVAAAACNLRVNRMATRPPMLREGVAPQDVANVRRRGTAVILGALTALLLSLATPRWGLIGFATIPLWRLPLKRYWRPVPA